jgi:N-acetylneuraminic acid mutarotase
MLFDSLLSSLEIELRASLDTCVTGMVVTARTQLEAALAEVAKERAKGLAEVARERAELHREIAAMQTHKEAQEGRVELNIGGRRFETSVRTLRRVPHTFFDAYFSGRYAQDVCDDGSIFVDRDGEHFGHILEYMRDGMVSVAAQEASELDVSLLRALKREFGFYCIELTSNAEEVFVVGGHAGDLVHSSMLERYDDVGRTWRAGASMKTGRSCFGLCALDGGIYVTGGVGAVNVALACVERYDPAFDTWNVAPVMPRSRYGHYACTVGNALYVLGGMEDTVGDEEEHATRSVLKFDSSTQAWSEVAPMTRPRSNFGACVLGSDIYVVGGSYSRDGDRKPSSAMFCYDTVTNAWSRLPPMPKAIMGHSVCVVSGLVYVIGGQTSQHLADMVSSALRFDPVTNAWSEVAPMSTPKTGLALFVLGGRLYAAGGISGVDEFSSAMERYNAVSDSRELVSGVGVNSGPRVDFGAQVMHTLEVNLFDSLQTTALRAH